MYYTTTQVTTYVITIVVIIALVIFIPLGIIRKRKHLSGEAGEQKVAKMLNSIKEKEELIFNNFLASRNAYNTASIQIDHIFISHKGIFVIETKDYKGRIYGSLNQTYWTQVLAYGNVKNKLYNPIKQNETHSEYIYRLLDRKYRIYNAVIFFVSRKTRDKRWAFFI